MAGEPISVREARDLKAIFKPASCLRCSERVLVLRSASAAGHDPVAFEVERVLSIHRCHAHRIHEVVPLTWLQPPEDE